MKKKKGYKSQGHAQLSKKARIHRVVFMLNDEEYKAMLAHFSRYKIENRSRWYRELIFTNIFRIQEEDYPTLFKESEMRG
ncbi:MAG: hypothetical protein LBH58_10130 [Tannerellaceae bacterium]|jgi:hypothetical protein|nr:hypothetical protein [Tannerellaceae bacterium]